MVAEYLEELWLTIASIFLVLFEALVATITICLPDSFIQWCTAKTHRLLNVDRLLAEEADKDAAYARVKTVMNATSFSEICAMYGYTTQEHVVQTTDGYLLGLHRITGKLGEESPEKKPIVYLHHGLLMNSEVWVSVTDPAKSIAFTLSDLGYDVWLGNNRGNKYSKKHNRLSPSSTQFWNFSIDEFALYDIPDSIRYILNLTGKETLSYLGFSQGSAQAFAALSIHPLLNRHVDTFIALAPAMAPPGIQPKRIQAFMNASPSLLFKLFGQRIILKSTAFWQNIMEPNLFVLVIDTALNYLFRWKGDNIPYTQKLVGYNHLYSFTSVKSVVHWFQIIRSGKLQMYDDETTSYRWLTKFYQPHQYPTRNITTPIHVIYGKNDSLVELETLISSVPKTTQTHGIDGYEHLDLLWGRAVSTEVIPLVESILQGVASNHLLPAKNSTNSTPRSKTRDRRSSISTQASSKGSMMIGSLF